MKYYIIGCGGVGSWLTPSLALLTKADSLVLVDGDKLEKSNLNRQLFTSADIGLNKAEALAKRYLTRSHPLFFHVGSFPLEYDDWLMVCVDNHRARAAALAACDMHGCQAILAANETHSAEAYYYHPEWKGGPLDPRIYYPEIETDQSGDPMARSIGCTGEAQQNNRQLVSANFTAAALAQQLFVLWAMEVPKLDKEVLPNLPFKLMSNLSSVQMIRIREVVNSQVERTE